MYAVRLKGTAKTLRVGKVVCLARNYSDHIRELGNETPEKPVLFIKPSSSVIGNREPVVIPDFSKDCHHEVELAVLIGKWAKNVNAKDALDYVAGYGVALDMTLRDVQNDLKKKGLPWEIAKGFDTACPSRPGPINTIFGFTVPESPGGRPLRFPQPSGRRP